MQRKVTIFMFLHQICPKIVFPLKNKKREWHDSILHGRISVGTKFQHKVTIFMSWNKFAQEEYFHSKTKKENSMIEFCMLELM